jgi:hypothetical protein
LQGIFNTKWNKSEIYQKGIDGKLPYLITEAFHLFRLLELKKGKYEKNIRANNFRF